MSIRNNEAVYDEQIAPLMTQIIAICKEHGIPMAATFEYEPEGYCSTTLPFDGCARELVGVRPFQITTTKADGSKIIEVVIP